MGKQSKEECQSEVKYLLEKLSLWKEETNKQLSNIINSHTSNINKSVNDLADEVCNLQTKLSIITKERDDLLGNVAELSGENRQLKAVIHIVQPSQDHEESNHCADQKQNTLEGPKITHQNYDEEQHLDNGGKSDTIEDEGYDCPKKLEGLKLVDKGRNEEQSGKWKCEQCPYEAFLKGHMRQHIKAVHENIRDYVCEKCGFATSVQSNLQIHRIAVHKMGEKEFKCDQCPYSAYHKYHLKSHIKDVHDKIKAHKCTYCEYATSRKSNLKKHITSVHNM